MRTEIPGSRRRLAWARSPLNDVPNIQLAGTAGTVNEGEIVLLNGKNVGGRAGGPDDNPLGALGMWEPRR